MNTKNLKRLIITLIGVLCLTIVATTTVYGKENTSQSQMALDKATKLSNLKQMDIETNEKYMSNLIAIEKPTETDEQALTLAFEAQFPSNDYTVYFKQGITKLDSYVGDMNQSNYSTETKEQVIKLINKNAEINRKQKTKTIMIISIAVSLIIAVIILLIRIFV